ncbi:Mur ligase [Crepidotus variabilis]|uniref:Mur ligase n=1 Tax=Crepidotus variabilis TaxID=179855 RepID=A0A9P6E583_9AGAR|nr:Mur ligase [Crepidotus variabilis]
MSIDLSLDRLQKLVTHLSPYTRPTLHIAGTNGKGSVSALLASILLHSDPPLRVGRFNSPHLVTVHDCITVNNHPVAPNLYEVVREEVEDADTEHETKLSSFEILTLVALQVFEREKVDIVVLEVGMGGRLDATNIVPDNTIAVSALTAVDLDHQFFLGDTVTKIAAEKAAIGRKGRPFVLGKQRREGVEEVVRTVLKAAGALNLALALEPEVSEWDESIHGAKPPPISLAYTNATKSSFSRPPSQPVSVVMPYFSAPVNALLPLYGSHQLDNLGTALSVINELLNSPPPPTLSIDLTSRITPQTIARGIRAVRWPGRLSFHTLHVSIPATSRKAPEDGTPSLPAAMRQTKHPLVVLADGAHNAASAETLSEYINHMLSLALESASSAIASQTVKKSITLDITYVLALSHSPPKTPLQTLSPVLPPKLPESLASSPIPITVNTSVALLQFTPPEGMPWVKSVPPSELEEVVRKLVPNADIYVPPASIPLASYVVSSPPFSLSSQPTLPPSAKPMALEDVLKWVALRQDRLTSSTDTLGLGLVVLAGSLYLVADFYRLLELDEVEKATRKMSISWDSR